MQELWSQTASWPRWCRPRSIGRSLNADDHRNLVDEAVAELRAAPAQASRLRLASAVAPHACATRDAKPQAADPSATHEREHRQRPRHETVLDAGSGAGAGLRRGAPRRRRQAQPDRPGAGRAGLAGRGRLRRRPAVRGVPGQRRHRPQAEGGGHPPRLRRQGQRPVPATSCWSSTTTSGSTCSAASCGRAGELHDERRPVAGAWSRRRAAGRRPARTAVAGAAASNTSKEPVLTLRVDPDLLGGLVVRVGDWVYDAIVRTRLENVRKQLIERGSHVKV